MSDSILNKALEFLGDLPLFLHPWLKRGRNFDYRARIITNN